MATPKQNQTVSTDATVAFALVSLGQGDTATNWPEGSRVDVPVLYRRDLAAAHEAVRLRHHGRRVVNRLLATLAGAMLFFAGVELGIIIGGCL